MRSILADIDKWKILLQKMRDLSGQKNAFASGLKGKKEEDEKSTGEKNQS